MENDLAIDYAAPSLWKVVNIYPENQDTTTLEITPTASTTSIKAKPGQFNMLYCFGVGEIPISFSKIDLHSVQHTIRKVGAVSAALTSLQINTTIGVRGPFGSFFAKEHAYQKDIIIIAGGVGLAPLKPLIEEICAKPSKFGKVYLLYGTRDPASTLFTKELSKWQKFMHILQTVDHAPSGWSAHVGVVTDLLKQIDIQAFRTVAFVCGPEIMMRFALRDLKEKGILPANIYLSMERNMKCAIGFCGHCQHAGQFICKDGPVFAYQKIANLLPIKEL